ncbi:MAG: HigA family addiction module antitoxin [Betaproteobacteria bacterium]|nr:HigA family addiction module antitoxin [Betaproteobacteria bacterium]
MATARPATRRAPKPGLAARRSPIHPGHFLDTRFLKPLGITQLALAEALGVSRRRVNELVRGRRGISHDTALKLAAHFGNEPEFWLQLQLAWDMHRVIKGRSPR